MHPSPVRQTRRAVRPRCLAILAFLLLLPGVPRAGADAYFAPGPNQALEVELDDLERLADDLARDRNFSTALDRVEEAILRRPGVPRLHLIRAIQLGRLERWNDAAAACLRARERATDDGYRALADKNRRIYEEKRDRQEKAWQDLYQERPGADTRALLGRFSLLQGHLDQARQHLEASLALDPRESNALTLRAQILHATGADTNAVLAACDEAVAAGDRAEAVALRRRLHRGNGDLAWVRDDYTRVIATAPDHALLIGARGAVRLELGDLAGALEDSQRALELDPEQPTALTTRAEVWIARIQPGQEPCEPLQRLVAYAEGVLAKEPGRREVWAQLLRGYNRAGQWSTTFTTFKKARATPSVEMLRLAVLAATQDGKPWDAAYEARMAVEDNGYRDPFLQGVCGASLYDEIAKSAEGDLRKAAVARCVAVNLDLVKRFPASPDAELAGLRLLRLVDDNLLGPEAGNVLADLVAAHPESATLLERLALYESANDRHDEARAHADALVKLTYPNPIARCTRGEIRLAAGDGQGALTDFDEVLELAPNVIEAIHGRIKALGTLERYDEAFRAADQCLQKHPDDVDVLLLRADLNRLQRFDLDAAYADYQRAQQLHPGEPVKSRADRAISQILGLGLVYKHYGGDLLRRAQGNPSVLHTRAREYFDAKKYEIATYGFDYLAQNRKDDVLAQFWAGTANLLAFHYDSAEMYFKRGLQLDPKLAALHRNLGVTYLDRWIDRRQAGDRDAAKRELDLAVELNPSDAGAFQGLARLFNEMGDLARASEYRDRTRALNPELDVDLTKARTAVQEAVEAERWAARREAQAEAQARAEEAARRAEEAAQRAHAAANPPWLVKLRAEAAAMQFGLDPKWSAMVSANRDLGSRLQQNVTRELDRASQVHSIENRFGYNSRAAELARQLR